MRRAVRASLALSAVAATLTVVVPAADARPSVPSAGTDRAADAAVADLRDAAGGALALTRDPDTGQVTALDAPTPIDLGSTDATTAAEEFVDRYGDALGGDGTDLVATGTTPRRGDGAAVRFQQAVDGVPVLGGESAVQVDGRGDVVSTVADLSADADDVDTHAGTTADAAVDAALVALGKTGADRAALRTATPELAVFDPAVLGASETGGARLVWRVDVSGPEQQQIVLVDADTAGVVTVIGDQPEARQRTICDAHNQPDANPCQADDRVENGEPSGVADVDGAYAAMGAWYDFFWTRFNRDSLDGNGLPLRATVRHCKPGPEPCPYANSYWYNPTGLTGQERAVFGQGYTADDIVGHELTHGLNDFTAGLFHWYQSGAIEESFADLFGELIDQTDGIGNEVDNPQLWLIGEDRPSGYIRNMIDPGAKGQPATMTSPNYATGPADDGGVHANAGVGNRAAALMVQGDAGLGISALGIDKVATLYYETLTGYLTSGADYAQLAAALRMACGDLVSHGQGGITFADCQSVDDALGAVQMDTEPPTGAWPEAPVCPSGIAPSNLFFDDFENTNSNTWTTQTTAGYAWSYPPPSYGRNATSGVQNLWGADTGAPGSSQTGGDHGDATIAMSSNIPLPANTHPYLRFDHAFGFETTAGVNRDGGVVEYSVNNGAWQDLGTAFVDNGYNGMLNATTTTNPLNGRPAFVNRSLGYTSSRADLTPFAGQNIRIRFHNSEDASVGSLGWFIDDVAVYLCPVPSVTATLSSPRPSVTVGDEIDMSLNITNTGNVPLSDVTVTDPEAPDCAGPVSTIAVGSSRTVTCEYQTVDPDDLGTYTNTATVGATQLSGTTASNTLSIPVLAPNTPLARLTQSADQTSVDAGEAVDLHLTITNVGNVALSGLAIVDQMATNCAGPVSLPEGATELAPEAAVTVDCTATPTTPGTWTNSASVTATELPGATAAEDLEIEVLDVTAPTVTVTTPAEGELFNLGQSVAADFDCVDDQPDNVASCTGTVDDGRSIDTSTPGPHEFAVTGTDGSGNHTIVTHSYTVASRRPDGRIRQGAAGITVGDDIVNATGAGQNRSAAAARGRTVTYFVTVQNDGSHTERLKVRGQPSTTNYSIRYQSGGVNITELVRKGAYLTPPMAPGAERTIKVTVTVGTRAPAGSQVDRLVTTTSTSDPVRKDVVRFIVRRR